jgi:AcrR family transcriptional regulator
MAPTKTKKPTDQVILDCAIEIISEHGEAAVRIADITERTGVSISSIYHFFTDREGLIAAAQVERYIENLNQLSSVVTRVLSVPTSREEFRDALLGLYQMLLVPELAPQRLARLNVLGGVVGRPSLASRLAEIQDDLVTRLARLFDAPLAKGWIRSDTDTVAMTSWLVGIYMQMAIIELGPSSVDHRSWGRINERAIRAVLFDEILPPDDEVGEPTG